MLNIRVLQDLSGKSPLDVFPLCHVLHYHESGDYVLSGRRTLERGVNVRGRYIIQFLILIPLYTVYFIFLLFIYFTSILFYSIILWFPLYYYFAFQTPDSPILTHFNYSSYSYIFPFPPFLPFFMFFTDFALIPTLSAQFQRYRVIWSSLV
jgi:hypothetical protein